MSTFILDVIASFLHIGGNGNIRIGWISSGRGILEVCQHVNKPIWQVKQFLVSSWPPPPLFFFFRAAFLANWSPMITCICCIIAFLQKCQLLIGGSVFFWMCKHIHLECFCITNPPALEEVPIKSFRGRCNKRCLEKDPASENSAALCAQGDPGEVVTGRWCVYPDREVSFPGHVFAKN